MYSVVWSSNILLAEDWRRTPARIKRAAECGEESETKDVFHPSCGQVVTLWSGSGRDAAAQWVACLQSPSKSLLANSTGKYPGTEVSQLLTVSSNQSRVLCSADVVIGWKSWLAAVPGLFPDRMCAVEWVQQNMRENFTLDPLEILSFYKKLSLLIVCLFYVIRLFAFQSLPLWRSS